MEEPNSSFFSLAWHSHRLSDVSLPQNDFPSLQVLCPEPSTCPSLSSTSHATHTTRGLQGLAPQLPPARQPCSEAGRSHYVKMIPGRRRGTRGFPAAPRERPRESFFNLSGEEQTAPRLAGCLGTYPPAGFALLLCAGLCGILQYSCLGNPMDRGT